MESVRGASAVLSDIRTVPETGSTNADLLDAARAGATEGIWLRAERQTAGRGRLGRAWQSAEGNLHASTLVRLRATDPPAATLALVAAVALAETAGVYLPDTVPRTLKWPNDLLVDGAKLSGILLERSDEAVVIGIGANLAHHPDVSDRATTSLREYGADVSPAAFLETFAEIFSLWLARWRGEGIAPVRARWLAHAHPIGTALTVRLPDQTALDGLFAGLDADGALILRLGGATRRVIHAGDVFLL